MGMILSFRVKLLFECLRLSRQHCCYSKAKGLGRSFLKYLALRQGGGDREHQKRKHWVVCPQMAAQTLEGAAGYAWSRVKVERERELQPSRSRPWAGIGVAYQEM